MSSNVKSVKICDSNPIVWPLIDNIILFYSISKGDATYTSKLIIVFFSTLVVDKYLNVYCAIYWLLVESTQGYNVGVIVSYGPRVDSIDGLKWAFSICFRIM